MGQFENIWQRGLTNSIINGIILSVGTDSIEDVIRQLDKSPNNVRFADLCRICDYYFGKARQKGSSHRIYKTPWQGDPRVNIQEEKGKAKAYQVRQVIKALKRLEAQSGNKSSSRY